MIIKIKAGQKVPADCILLKVDKDLRELEVREISGTGHPDDFFKVPL